MTKNITVSIPDWVYYEIWQKIPHGCKSEFVEKTLIASQDKIDELESNRKIDVKERIRQLLLLAQEEVED